MRRRAGREDRQARAGAARGRGRSGVHRRGQVIRRLPLVLGMEERKAPWRRREDIRTGAPRQDVLPHRVERSFRIVIEPLSQAMEEQNVPWIG